MGQGKIEVGFFYIKDRFEKEKKNGRGQNS